MEFIKLTEQKIKSGASYSVLTISRPKAMNALNAQLLNELESALNQVADGNSRCLVITGEGKAFVAGADITEFQNLTPEDAERLSRRGQQLFGQLEELDMPVIAAVNGFALGGGMELVLACDFAVASSNVKWGLPEVTLGLLPGYGGTQRLARKCGEAVAKRVALSGEMFNAEQGLRFGAFVEVFEPEKLMEAVLKMAENICARAPIAVKMTKACIDGGVEMGSEKGFDLEARAFYEIFKTQDKTEGIKAFLEKRTPEFVGR